MLRRTDRSSQRYCRTLGKPWGKGHGLFKDEESLSSISHAHLACGPPALSALRAPSTIRLAGAYPKSAGFGEGRGRAACVLFLKKGRCLLKITVFLPFSTDSCGTIPPSHSQILRMIADKPFSCHPYACFSPFQELFLVVSPYRILPTRKMSFFSHPGDWPPPALGGLYHACTRRVKGQSTPKGHVKPPRKVPRPCNGPAWRVYNGCEMESCI